PQSQRVELIDPDVIVPICAARGFDASHLGTWRRVERPAFGTVLASRGRALRHPALPAIKAGQVAAARQRRPDHPIGRDLDAARAITPVLTRRDAVVERRLVHFGPTGLGGMVASFQSNQGTRCRTGTGDPDRAVRRTGNDAV